MKNSMIPEWVFILALSAVFQGCAHNSLDRQIDNEVAGETAIRTHADLRAQTGELIQSAPGLSDDQRVKLSALRDATRAKNDEMWSQSLKLRSILIKNLISTDYNAAEARLIKERIKKLEQRRLDVIFNAVEQANKILGREAAENRPIMDEMWQRPLIEDFRQAHSRHN